MKKVAAVLTLLVLVGACKSSTKTSAPTTTARNSGAGTPVSASPGVTSPPATTPATAKSGPLQHAEDVTITSCAPDATTHYYAAMVTITNHSSKTSNYSITIAFDSPDGATQYDTGLVAADNLGPGQSKMDSATSLKDAAGPYTCKLADVTRYAS